MEPLGVIHQNEKVTFLLLCLPKEEARKGIHGRRRDSSAGISKRVQNKSRILHCVLFAPPASVHSQAGPEIINFYFFVPLCLCGELFYFLFRAGAR